MTTKRSPQPAHEDALEEPPRSIDTQPGRIAVLLKNPSAAVVLLLAACTALVTTSQAQEIGDPSKGRKFAQDICAQCHAVLPNEVISPRFNIASFRRIANTPGMTEQALSIWLTTSHPTMPNFFLEIEDRKNVVAYIASLKDK